MNRKLLPGLILALFAAAPAFAFDSFVVKDIRVEGIQRMVAGTVFNYLPVRVGERFDETQAADAIRAGDLRQSMFTVVPAPSAITA